MLERVLSLSSHTVYYTHKAQSLTTTTENSQHEVRGQSEKFAI